MNENWIYSILLLLSSITVILNIAQCQKNDGPIGAHRVYRKTSFSCQGRSTGYYADIETGCQVYHMCDGLGRQFSYSCPNTTLFQQRMLICDHWYMVNCSRAESDYDANLLIGQKDKPFVPDDEQHLRTPRPDLLDRPYAPDYSGESFRNQYEVPQVLNQIDGSDQDEDNAAKKHFQLNPPPSSTRWRISVPSRDILPPSSQSIRRMDDVDDINPDLGTSFSSNYNTSADVSSEEDKFQTVTKPSTSTSTTINNQKTFVTKNQSYKPTNSPTVYRKPTITTTTQSPKSFHITKQPISNAISETEIKVPSKLYEPPFLYPIWNENYTASEESKTSTTEKSVISTTTTTRTPFRIISTSAPFSVLPTAATTARPIPPPITRPTTSSGKPFTQKYTASTTLSYESATDKYSNSLETLQQSESSNRAPTSFNNYDFSRISSKTSSTSYNSKPTTLQLKERKTSNTQLLNQKPIVVASQPDEASNENENIPESIFDYNIPQSQRLNTPKSFSKPSSVALKSVTGQTSLNEVVTPSLDLVPPFPEYIQHDIATTQGPPIYYDWKIPSNALEPPKLDPPIGTEGRLPEYEIEFRKKQKGNTNQSQLQEQKLPLEQQQLPLENVLPTFLPDDSHSLQDSQLKQGSFGKKIQLQGIPPETPSLDLQPPFSDHLDFSSNSNDSISENNKSFPFSHNPFLSTLATKSQRSVNSSTKTPTSSPRPFSTSNKRELISGNHKKNSPASELQIQQLKRQLSVPDFLFPLENGRTGYDFNESKNSFQLKIPKRRSDDKSKWYGENPECPECHPSFAKPGTCEPCIKRR
ncbi:mucin-2 isoform X2 [Condylostylus longicornis]|uniref:mucin-2 isoform X2 n=1 Tax=Condylostylus longicornis TaxID=2530218 RepID=UPI00244E09C6|nr:mucin-2 isoform X2 [Condylostylus longicornis]